jgi:ABC-type phosphate transport system substrate-binding protein
VRSPLLGLSNKFRPRLWSALNPPVSLTSDGYFTGEAVTEEHYFEILKELHRKPNTIGYAALMDAEFGVSKGMVKIPGIQTDGTSPAVHASAQALKDGSYALRRPLYFYWSGPAARKDVQDFMGFLLQRTGGCL